MSSLGDFDLIKNEWMSEGRTSDEQFLRNLKLLVAYNVTPGKLRN